MSEKSGPNCPTCGEPTEVIFEEPNGPGVCPKCIVAIAHARAEIER